MDSALHGECQQWWQNLLVGGTARPFWLPPYFQWVSLCQQFCPTTSDKPTSLDSPGPMYAHMIGREEENTEETQSLSAWPPCKVAITASSVPDSVICYNGTKNRPVKPKADQTTCRWFCCLWQFHQSKLVTHKIMSVDNKIGNVRIM
jgi:hypothetical protein